MRPYRLIFYFFKCYLDRVQYPQRFQSLFALVDNRGMSQVLRHQASTSITTFPMLWPEAR